MSDLILKIIAKHQEDREVIKAMKQRHAAELLVVEEFQAKREAALLERGDMTAFAYLTDLYINGRDGKAETEKKKANIALDQAKIEAWLLKMLNGVGEGIRTEFGTVYKSRKESVSVADFDMFVDTVMLKDAAGEIAEKYAAQCDDPAVRPKQIADIVALIHQHMHLEYLNKAVNKTAILESMGTRNKDGSYEKAPPAGLNYCSIQCVGVRKSK